MNIIKWDKLEWYVDFQNSRLVCVVDHILIKKLDEQEVKYLRGVFSKNGRKS